MKELSGTHVERHGAFEKSEHGQQGPQHIPMQGATVQILEHDVLSHLDSEFHEGQE